MVNSCVIRLELDSSAAQQALANNCKFTSIEIDKKSQKTFVYFETIQSKLQPDKGGGDNSRRKSPGKDIQRVAFEKWNWKDDDADKTVENEKKKTPATNSFFSFFDRPSSFQNTRSLKNAGRRKEKNISILAQKPKVDQVAKITVKADHDTEKISSRRRVQRRNSCCSGETFESMKNQIDDSNNERQHSFNNRLSSRSTNTEKQSSTKEKKKKVQQAQMEMMYSNALDVSVSTVNSKFNANMEIKPARSKTNGRRRPERRNSIGTRAVFVAPERQNSTEEKARFAVMERRENINTGSMFEAMDQTNTVERRSRRGRRNSCI